MKPDLKTEIVFDPDTKLLVAETHRQSDLIHANASHQRQVLINAVDAFFESVDVSEDIGGLGKKRILAIENWQHLAACLRVGGSKRRLTASLADVKIAAINNR